jgi:hypothetical protein
MQGFQSSAGLIEEVLTMVIAQFLGPDDSVKIRLEQFLHQIHWGERWGLGVRLPSSNDWNETGLMMSSTEMI